MLWTEYGGPAIDSDVEEGFGTTLIRQALPCEMGGESSLEFNADGLRARIWIPSKLLDQATEEEDTGTLKHVPLHKPSLAAFKAGRTMILEDNFMIASDLTFELSEIGLSNTELFARKEEAEEYLLSETPALALLDVNLGKDETSESVALMLKRRNVPFVFITGYGDRLNPIDELKDVPIITKPVSRTALQECLGQLQTRKSVKF